MSEHLQSKPFDVTVFDFGLKVFRIGETMGIKSLYEPSVLVKNGRAIHSHFTYEIFFVTDGRLDLEVGEHSGAYERKVLIIPPKVGHFSCPSKEGSFCLLFSFEETQKPGRRQRFLEERLQQGLCELPLSDEMIFYIRQTADKSLRPSFVAQQEKVLLTTLLFYEVFSQLLPEQTLQLPEKGNAKHIYAIEAYINCNMNKKLTISDLAEHMSLSSRQISRIIRKEYGCTLSELITDKKLANAERLVKNSDLRIDEIAARVALGSPNYFYALFKKRYGMSPLQYRKQFHTTQQP